MMTKRSEDEDFDPRTHLTKHQTGARYDINAERSEINSWPELDYLHWKEFNYKCLGVSFYGQAVRDYLSFKISKDRGSRIENTIILSRFDQEARELYGGYPIVIDALHEMQETRERKKRWFRRNE